MAKTTQQLAVRVLERLKVIAAGDTPSSADAEAVKTYYANVYPEMQDDNLVFWDEASIDTRAFEALADFIAGRLAPDFTEPRPDLEASGIDRLRRLSADVPSYLPAQNEYF